MKHVVCQHCPEPLEQYPNGQWHTVPTLPVRAGSPHCKGLPTLLHKPMPEIVIHRA